MNTFQADQIEVAEYILRQHLNEHFKPYASQRLAMKNPGHPARAFYAGEHERLWTNYTSKLNLDFARSPVALEATNLLRAYRLEAQRKGEQVFRIRAYDWVLKNASPRFWTDFAALTYAYKGSLVAPEVFSQAEWLRMFEVRATPRERELYAPYLATWTAPLDFAWSVDFLLLHVFDETYDGFVGEIASLEALRSEPEYADYDWQYIEVLDEQEGQQMGTADRKYAGDIIGFYQGPDPMKPSTVLVQVKTTSYLVSVRKGAGAPTWAKKARHREHGKHAAFIKAFPGSQVFELDGQAVRDRGTVELIDPDALGCPSCDDYRLV